MSILRTPETTKESVTFSDDERIIMMIYTPGTRLGLIRIFEEMLPELTPNDKELECWMTSALKKLRLISDEEFEELELMP